MGSSTAKSEEEFTSTQKSELVERVAASANFRRALRLRDFLLYVGEASARNDVSEVHEQDIGIKVFGRSPDYDRGADNIVRVNATELRKRVDQYFAVEGASEPYIFQIPRGAYKLTFSRRTAADSAPVTAPIIEPEPVFLPAVAAPQKSHGSMWLAISLGIVCLALATLLYRSYTTTAKADAAPAVMQFWRSFTHDSEAGSQTDIVLSDESLSLMEDILRRPVGLQEYVDRSYINAVDTAAVSEDRKADVHELLRHNLVTLGSVVAANQILILPGLTQHFHVTVPRLYPPDLMKRNNLVVLGGKKSNPWAGFFDDQLNFTLDFDPKTSQNFVRNHHPASDEKANYQPEGTSSLPSGIAIVSYIPNPSHSGEVLLLAGSDSDATAAAAEFVTSESSIKQLLTRFGRSQLPHFELVLRTTRLNGTSFSSEIVASRIR